MARCHVSGRRPHQTSTEALVAQVAWTDWPIAPTARVFAEDQSAIRSCNPRSPSSRSSRSWGPRRSKSWSVSRAAESFGNPISPYVPGSPSYSLRHLDPGRIQLHTDVCKGGRWGSGSLG